MSQNAARSADQPAPTVRPHHQRAFGRAFWMLNSIEMFERLAYFGIRSVVPLYIMQATEPGGLHVTAVDKGIVYMWWAILQSWLPMFTGGIADRYGYKRVLACAISANVIGYLMMAFLHSYVGFFLGIMVIATGTAFFKPALQGSIAQNLTKENSSVGWGMFYWVVNVGAVLAPIFATILLGKPHSAIGWRNLFLASAAYTACNLLLLLTFRDVPSGADKSLGLSRVFARTVENIWPYWFVGGRLHPLRGPGGLVLVAVGLALFIWYQQSDALLMGVGGGSFFLGALLATWLEGGKFQWQLRLPAFLLIMSCFWMMMYQLWDLHPNFITDWVDSSSAAHGLRGMRDVAVVGPLLASWTEYGDRGLLQIPQQMLLNLDAALIVALVIPVTWAARRMRTLSAMLIGMSVATIGILVAGLTSSGWVLLGGIVFFSLGEMWTGPKKNEYLGLIAPPGKKGLYLGYVNIPVGIGVGIGSWVAGVVYANYGEKATLALKELGAHPELISRAVRSIDWSDSLDAVAEMIGVPQADAFAVARQELDQDDAAAAETLRELYCYDDGQIINLGLRYLEAQHAPRTKRSEVFDVVRERMNAQQPAGQPLADSQIVDELWKRFGEQPSVLNDLALEYLAQGTDRLADAAGRIKLVHPVQDLEKKVHLDRTKSFAALSAAVGATPEAVDAALGEFANAVPDPQARVYVYLAGLPHIRFLAVARRNWTHDVPLLRRLLESDPAALEAAENGLRRPTLAGRISAFFTGGDAQQDLIARLAEHPDVIQEALSQRDWSREPDLARQLLRLGYYEARSRLSVEVAESRLAVTRQLWESYGPQFRVWIPFAAVGVVATIALAIFGQMAKRWADMNA